MSEAISHTEIIVMFQGAATKEEIAALMETINGRIVNSITTMKYLSYLILVPSDTVEDCLERLSNQPIVFASQLNHEQRAV